MAEQIVKAPMRGRVLRVHVEKGSQVKERDRMCDIEALKMEMPIMAPASGTIKEVYISAGEEIGGGDPLFVIES
jgi:biotin carboxyl carrier protein